MEKILLVEPDYKNKYPPIGLMKIATFHKMRGDYVEFYKGNAPFTTISKMNRVYITSLFTFHFDIVVNTINHYLNYINSDCVYFGGIAATLMEEKFRSATKIKHINTGQLTNSNMIGYDDNINVDILPLDYDILDDIQYIYPAGDNFFAYATRGCYRGCDFCAVKTLEPHFIDTNNLLNQIEYTRNNFGDKRNLLLMDNNILFSNNLDKLVKDLLSLGFQKDTPNFTPTNQYEAILKKIQQRKKTSNSYVKLQDDLVSFLENFKKRIKKAQILNEFEKNLENVKNNNISLDCLEQHSDFFITIIEKYRTKRPLQRYVDFNQGIDARLLNHNNMKILAQLPLRPFRLAYDNIEDTDIYCEAFRIAYHHGVRHFSNYMLYNYDDTPTDLWERAYNNVKLYNQMEDVSAFSFAMKYAPIDKTDRSYIGKNWNKKYLSAMSVILNVTNGVTAKEEDFFFKAYGNSPKEFLILLTMPNEFIKHRFFFEKVNFIQSWREKYDALSLDFRKELLDILNKVKEKESASLELRMILRFYSVTKHQVVSGKVQLEDILSI